MGLPGKGQDDMGGRIAEDIPRMLSDYMGLWLLVLRRWEMHGFSIMSVGVWFDSLGLDRIHPLLVSLGSQVYGSFHARRVVLYVWLFPG